MERNHVTRNSCWALRCDKQRAEGGTGIPAVELEPYRGDVALMWEAKAYDVAPDFLAGFTPALRSGCTAFKGAAVSPQTAGRISGPVMADAWVRVVPSDSVAVGKQADRLVAGAGACLCDSSRGS